jgi:hypothetical protein
LLFSLLLSDYIILKKIKRVDFLKYAFLIIPPSILLFNLFIKLTDLKGDRPQNPYGLRGYMLEWEGIFLPISLPSINIINSITKVRPVGWETLGYVGFASFVLSIIIIISVLLYRKKTLNKLLHSNPTKVYLLAGFLCLCFGFLFPRIGSLPEIYPYLGPLKQFRSLGRLSWIFFYLINIFSFYSLYSLLKSNKVGNIVFSVLLILITTIESISFTILVSSDLKNENIFVSTFSLSDFI